MNHSKGNPSQYRKEFRLILLQVLKVTPTVRCYQNTSVTKRLCPPVAHLPQQVRFCGEFLLKQLKTAEVFMSQVAIQFQHNGSFNEVFCKLPLPVRQNSQQNSVTPNMAKLHPPGNSPSHLPTLNLNPPPLFGPSTCVMFTAQTSGEPGRSEKSFLQGCRGISPQEVRKTQPKSP